MTSTSVALLAQSGTTGRLNNAPSHVAFPESSSRPPVGHVQCRGRSHQQLEAMRLAPEAGDTGGHLGSHPELLAGEPEGVRETPRASRTPRNDSQGQRPHDPVDLSGVWQLGPAGPTLMMGGGGQEHGVSDHDWAKLRAACSQKTGGPFEPVMIVSRTGHPVHCALQELIHCACHHTGIFP
jgi:hypothetical protein